MLQSKNKFHDQEIHPSNVREMLSKLGWPIRAGALRIIRYIYKKRPEPILIHLLQIPFDLLTVLIGPDPQMKFVIFCQGRTGSTLLESLLASHPMIDRAWELLDKRKRKWNLFLYVNARARLSEKKIWGLKVKLFQLSNEQKVDPRKFLARLHERGWKIIYLKRRNILRQAVSHFVRVHRGKLHKKDNTPEHIFFRIEFKDLMKRIEEQKTYLAKEEEILRELPHITLVYEDDLLRKEVHQRTLDRLFMFFGVPIAPVRTDMLKITPENMSKVIENFDELAQILRKTEYRMYLEEE